MTTLALAHSLARHLREKDLTVMHAAAKGDILRAINAGLQKIARWMPMESKASAVSGTLRAAATVAFTFEARYLNETTAHVFTAAQKGCTVLLGDDPARNEIVGTNAVLDEYLGTALTGTATIYGDAVQIFEVIKRALSAPVLTHNGNQVRELVKRQEGSRILQHAIGRPELYWLEPVGSSQGGDPCYFFKVWPMPDTDYKFRFDAELAPARVTFDQITQRPADIALPEDTIESCLVPIALGELVTSPEWENPATIQIILGNATEALGGLRLQPAGFAAPFNIIGTPEGW